MQFNTSQSRSAWTEQEDELLRAAVRRFGDRAWANVAQDVPGRSSKSCSDRWRNFLSPDIEHPRKSPFTEWEVAVVVQAQMRYGNNWKAISMLLPGRTNRAVKNLYVGNLKWGARLPEIRNRYLEASTTLEALLEIKPDHAGGMPRARPGASGGSPSSARAASTSSAGSAWASDITDQPLSGSPASAGMHERRGKRGTGAAEPGQSPATSKRRRQAHPSPVALPHQQHYHMSHAPYSPNAVPHPGALGPSGSPCLGVPGGCNSPTLLQPNNTGVLLPPIIKQRLSNPGGDPLAMGDGLPNLGDGSPCLTPHGGAYGGLALPGSFGGAPPAAGPVGIPGVPISVTGAQERAPGWHMDPAAAAATYGASPFAPYTHAGQGAQHHAATLMPGTGVASLNGIAAESLHAMEGGACNTTHTAAGGWPGGDAAPAGHYRAQPTEHGQDTGALPRQRSFINVAASLQAAGLACPGSPQLAGLDGAQMLQPLRSNDSLGLDLLDGTMPGDEDELGVLPAAPEGLWPASATGHHATAAGPAATARRVLPPPQQRLPAARTGLAPIELARTVAWPGVAWHEAVDSATSAVTGGPATPAQPQQGGAFAAGGAGGGVSVSLVSAALSSQQHQYQQQQQQQQHQYQQHHQQAYDAAAWASMPQQPWAGWQQPSMHAPPAGAAHHGDAVLSDAAQQQQQERLQHMCDEMAMQNKMMQSQVAAAATRVASLHEQVPAAEHGTTGLPWQVCGQPSPTGTGTPSAQCKPAAMGGKAAAMPCALVAAAGTAPRVSQLSDGGDALGQLLARDTNMDELPSLAAGRIGGSSAGGHHWATLALGGFGSDGGAGGLLSLGGAGDTDAALLSPRSFACMANTFL